MTSTGEQVRAKRRSLPYHDRSCETPARDGVSQLRARQRRGGADQHTRVTNRLETCVTTHFGPEWNLVQQNRNCGG
jgi:hypothetical protein